VLRPVAGGERRVSTRTWLARRRLVVVVVVLALAIAGSAAWAANRSSSTGPQLGTAQSGTIRQTVAATGTIAPAQQANLNFGVGGQVTAVSVTPGQQVAAGQTLATIDSATLPSQVAQAKATVASDQAKIASDSGASSAQRDADTAALASAQAQLAVAQQSLAKASITAPFAGTVAAVNLTVGQQVSAGGTTSTSTGSGGSTGGGGTGSSAAGGSAAGGSASSATPPASTAQVVVITTDSYLVNASVDDTQIGQLKAGLQAVIVPNGSTTQVFGTVSSVGMVGTQTSGVASYPVVIAVTGNPGGLHAGASAQVAVIVKQLTDVLVVPSAAVHQENGRSVVYEIQDGNQVSVPVTVGLSGGGQTQIMDGITDGTQIVLPEAPAGGNTTQGGRGAGGGFGGLGGGGGGGGAGGAGGGGRPGGAGAGGGGGGGSGPAGTGGGG
jgi:multidrug efflux pump subunit AcrA (membrane-fusion protein)